MTEDMHDARLDELLAAHAVREPAAALRARIVAAAPRERAIGRTWRWVAGAGLGAMLAGCCAAGVAAGLTLAPASFARAITGRPAQPAADVSSLADPADDAAVS
jgi:hypothetical protein